jgi:hypothetical protein
MQDRYEAPAVEDRTPVAEPLNTLINGSDNTQRTPVWRTKRDEQ